MNSFEITEICRIIPYFIGVFARNEVPKIRKNVRFACFVYNLDDKNSQGTHWVCFLKYRQKYVYFDSFGSLPPTKEIVKRYGKNIIYNKKKFQRYNTSTCGKWVIRFLFHIYKRYFLRGKKRLDNKIFIFK
jgi:hypothetical protein